MPAGDAIACVPTTLVAICLNTAGAERVKNSGALECLVPVFTTPTYIRALNVSFSTLRAHFATFSSIRWRSGHKSDSCYPPIHLFVHIVITNDRL